MAHARPAGFISYRTEREGGLRDDVLFLFDLDVPAGFRSGGTPTGRWSASTLMDAADVLTRVAETDDFKFNVALVVIDWGLRHGLIDPDHPEYFALATGLRRPLD